MRSEYAYRYQKAAPLGAVEELTKGDIGQNY